MEVAMHAAVKPPPSGAKGFWALPSTRSLEKSWRPAWDRLVDQVRDSDPLTLYFAVEEGVPTSTIVLISKAFSEPAPQVLDLLGLPETTYRRKAEAGEALPEVAGHRTVALMRVVARLRQLLAESGDDRQVDDFDLEGWVGAWIKEPLPELGGETPAALLRNPEGQRVVETLLERMRGGLVA
jgi:putative toxin-antitoxin system antitoxin component (TIGR02293 family)